MTRPNTITFHTQDYRPGSGLDEELAALGYACIHGWPDQRPITASLVRSRLAPHPATALSGHGATDDVLDVQSTVLITGRSAIGQLVAAVALRPHTSASPGRLWGPIVHPDHQSQGLGRHLLDRLQPHLDRSPRLSLSTAEIPESRTRAATFFTSAGWTPSRTLLLFKGPLPPPAIPAETNPIVLGWGTVTLSHLGPEHEPGLGDLYKQCYPQTSMSVADATYVRWSSDERFTPDCTLTIENAGRLLAAVLVYPLTPTPPTRAAFSDGSDGSGEPAEALVADVLTDRSLRKRVARDLVRPLLRTALACAAECHGARGARALIDRRDAIAVDALTVCGLTPMQLFHCYQCGSNRQEAL
jgi:GNAT superfamily N-acetyltransferase